MIRQTQTKAATEIEPRSSSIASENAHRSSTEAAVETTMNFACLLHGISACAENLSIRKELKSLDPIPALHVVVCAVTNEALYCNNETEASGPTVTLTHNAYWFEKEFSEHFNASCQYLHFDKSILAIQFSVNLSAQRNDNHHQRCGVTKRTADNEPSCEQALQVLSDPWPRQDEWGHYGPESIKLDAPGPSIELRHSGHNLRHV
ncbi:hypothetical protein FHG87_007717 [Trinorchestia longiramus]|nr:hypothetical protein FHG87_007717 [Trinorchestia longiramus]